MLSNCVGEPSRITFVSYSSDVFTIIIIITFKNRLSKLYLLAVDIWLEYLQFSIGNIENEEDGSKKVRQLFESALTSVGLHTFKGAIIWEAFREFETVLFALVSERNIYSLVPIRFAIIYLVLFQSDRSLEYCRKEGTIGTYRKSFSPAIGVSSARYGEDTRRV